VGHDGSSWSWERWALSGGDRFQGGTLRGVQSKLDYLANLGVGAIWLSPVFKQPGHTDSYHGYGLQNFLDVDLRFGTRADLGALIEAAHAKGIRVILDVIFNHSGHNWNYPGNVGEHDRYLRETLFGPLHPRLVGRAGLAAGSDDLTLPGFGPFGTAGARVFDPGFVAYKSIAALAAVRARFPVLRKGRQYARQVSLFGGPFVFRGAGESVAWSRVLSDEEALVVVNAHGNSARGGDVVVDANLNPPVPSFRCAALPTALRAWRSGICRHPPCSC
jgi:hypothetical protein